ncbi:sensor histidine kinase [Actinoplanes palleronii]|uniref:histidine kinase n=1 Tax=Actinoplanes palleronii TaxID=113570 RepID=A0ABQ4BLG2_9ACTN|nr:histidine kinase [Actinoplanes palleronii]GIE71508.1 histidine kinase [Actinoplanes palleronii]
MLRPLVTAATYRRAVFLLLGGVLALPYAIGAGLLVGAFVKEPGGWLGKAPVALAGVVIALIPPFLGGTRELEIAAARSLLAVDLPAPDRRRALELETRLRAALWFGLHLCTGVAIGALLLIVLPVGMLAMAGGEALGTRFSWWWLPAGPVILAGVLYAVAGLGRLAATMAPVLLGPSPGERERRLADRERRLAERNRLARELHDAVGHALTAMTLQAGAARAVFDTDPGFARTALTAIEETGRSAADELDTVLGLLRDEAAGRETNGRESAPTLAELDRLLHDQVTAEVGAVDVPPRLSREAYRIVQESLTNAARHGAGPVTLRIRQDGDLMIEVTNPRAVTPAGRPGGGHGIAGMRDRVRLLGGSLEAGPDGATWRVVARLPGSPG